MAFGALIRLGALSEGGARMVIALLAALFWLLLGPLHLAAQVVGMLRKTLRPAVLECMATEDGSGRTREPEAERAEVRSHNAVALDGSAKPASGRKFTASRIDCGCYYTDNIYIRSPIEGHFTYENEETFTRADSEYAPLLNRLSPSTHATLIASLEQEVVRRRSQPALAAARRTRIAKEYVPLHPQLWTLDADAWLHPDFVRLVLSAKAAASGEAMEEEWRGAGDEQGGRGSVTQETYSVRRRDRATKAEQDGRVERVEDRGGAQSASRGRCGLEVLREVGDGIFTLPVFSPAFCALLCEELDHLQQSGLPCGQPNSMNRFGALLDEVGFTPGLIDPLVAEWVQPLCASLPALAAVGGGSLDEHRAFVVRYEVGRDEALSAHFDNAEATLNANIGASFEGGDLCFFGHKDHDEADAALASAPVAAHAWGDYPVGHGVLHAGHHIHAAQPISSGTRLNLVVWMRSSAWRREAGCPMCGETRRLLSAEEQARDADTLKRGAEGRHAAVKACAQSDSSVS